MKRAIHGAPTEALRQALGALAQLSFWISWTSDPDLAPEPVISARCMRDAAMALRKAARLLDEAADRADPPPRHRTARGPSRLQPVPGRGLRGRRRPTRRRRPRPATTATRGGAEPGPGGRASAGEDRLPRVRSSIDGDSHEPHRTPARAGDPGHPALPARACARERAQDPARRGRRRPAHRVHKVPRPAGEPRRPPRRTRRGRRRALRRRRRRAAPRGPRRARQGRLVQRPPSGAVQDRRERRCGRAVARGERGAHCDAPRPTRWSRSAGSRRTAPPSPPSPRASASPSVWWSSACGSATPRPSCSTPTAPTRSTSRR